MSGKIMEKDEPVIGNDAPWLKTLDGLGRSLTDDATEFARPRRRMVCEEPYGIWGIPGGLALDSELRFVKLPWVCEIFRPRTSKEKELVSSSSRRLLDFVLVEAADSFLERFLVDKSKSSDK